MTGHAEAVREAVKLMRNLPVGCEDLHHERSEYHSLNQPCPVVAKIRAAADRLESTLAPEGAPEPDAELRRLADEWLALRYEHGKGGIGVQWVRLFVREVAPMLRARAVRTPETTTEGGTDA